MLRGIAGFCLGSDPGIGGEAAVYGDDDAGDETGGGVVQQEHQRADQLLGLADYESNSAALPAYAATYVFYYR